MPITNVVDATDLARWAGFGWATLAGAPPPRAVVRGTTYGSTVLADPDPVVVAVAGDLA